MTQARFLTPEEANLIQHAAQSWLRLRDVEFNAAEDAVAVLAASHVREEDCMRDDIATLGRTVLLAVPGEPEAIPITLVRPRDEDLCQGRVSVLSELGLACVGQVQGSRIRIPHGVALLAGFASDDPTRDPLDLATPSPTVTEGEPA